MNSKQCEGPKQNPKPENCLVSLRNRPMRPGQSKRKEQEDNRNVRSQSLAHCKVLTFIVDGEEPLEGFKQ